MKTKLSKMNKKKNNKKRKKRPVRLYKDSLGLFAKNGDSELRFSLKNKYKNPFKNAGKLLAKFLMKNNRKRKNAIRQSGESAAFGKQERKEPSSGPKSLGTVRNKIDGMAVTQGMMDANVYALASLKETTARVDELKKPKLTSIPEEDPPAKLPKKTQLMIEDFKPRSSYFEGQLEYLTVANLQELVGVPDKTIKKYLGIKKVNKPHYIKYLIDNMPDFIRDGLSVPIEVGDGKKDTKKLQREILKNIAAASEGKKADVEVIPDQKVEPAKLEEVELPPANVTDAIPEETKEEQKDESEVIDEAIKRKGEGKLKMDGLYDDQINKMMASYKSKGYLGCISSDEIDSLSPEDDQIGFVMNTLPSTATEQDYQQGGHWVAVYIDFTNDKSIEYFDPFADPPADSFFVQIKNLIEKKKLPYYLKMKINKIKVQDERTSTCGFHSAKFLMDRFSGKPFKECSGYSDTKRGEQGAKKLRKKFGYI